MIILSLIVAFQLSVFVHIQFIAGYVSSKKNKDFIGFLVTTFTNMLIGMILAIVVLNNGKAIHQLNLDFMLTLESGLLFAFLVYLKVKVTITIIKRMKDPQYYHITYFGKKVYDKSVVTMKELGVYYVTVPFTLIAGAYFIVKVFKL